MRFFQILAILRHEGKASRCPSWVDSVEKLRKAIWLVISDRSTDSRRIDDLICVP